MHSNDVSLWNALDLEFKLWIHLSYSMMYTYKHARYAGRYTPRENFDVWQILKFSREPLSWFWNLLDLSSIKAVILRGDLLPSISLRLTFQVHRLVKARFCAIFFMPHGSQLRRRPNLCPSLALIVRRLRVQCFHHPPRAYSRASFRVESYVHTRSLYPDISYYEWGYVRCSRSIYPDA